MRPLDAYSDLKGLGSPIVETRVAATRLGMATQNTARLLREAEDAGLVTRLRKGLWLLEPSLDTQAIAPYLTAPFPAYISLWSALFAHDMIEQIPRRTYVVSLARAHRIATSRGVFDVHHVMPELFGGFAEITAGRLVATPAKALFDGAYLRAVRRAPFSVPELSLPSDFDVRELSAWVAKVPSTGVRTITRRLLDQVLAGATN